MQYLKISPLSFKHLKQKPNNRASVLTKAIFSKEEALG